MSAKVTVRELDGTEYQLKRRIGQMIVQSGYAVEIKRGLIAMTALSLVHALKIVSDDRIQSGIGPDGCSLAVYPATDYRTKPAPFGSSQDWNAFPLESPKTF